MLESDLSTWIKTEHDEVNVFADKLSQRVAVIPRRVTDLWLADTRKDFHEFAEHLRKHMMLEEQDGFMSVITERRPSLAPRVERLLEEHRDLTEMLGQMETTLESLTPARLLLIRDLCTRIRSFLSYIEHHERAENDLLEFTFTDDIGEKD